MLLAAFIIMLTAVAVWCGVDQVTRVPLTTAPTIFVDRAPGDSKTAVVYLTGTQSDGEVASRNLRPLWKQYGDVVVVQYSKELFKAGAVVRTVYMYLTENGYDRVILIGASFGGRLSVDFVDYNNQQTKRLTIIGLVLVDPPMDKSDVPQKRFLGVNLAFLAGYPVGWLTGKVWGGMVPCEATGNGESQVDQAQVDANFKAGCTWPLASYMGQLHDIVVREALESGSYASYKLVILRSTDDKVVSQAATAKWLSAFGPSARILFVISEHAAFPNFPRAWHEAFGDALAAIA